MKLHSAAQTKLCHAYRTLRSRDCLFGLITCLLCPLTTQAAQPLPRLPDGGTHPDNGLLRTSVLFYTLKIQEAKEKESRIHELITAIMPWFALVYRVGPLTHTVMKDIIEISDL